MGTLDQLPVEVISLIVKHLCDFDYYECALVNKLFYTTTNPLLWEAPNLECEYRFNKIVTTILVSPHQDVLIHHIRHVEIGFPISEASFLLFMKQIPLVEKLAIQQGRVTDTTFKVLPRYCPQLKCIHIQDSTISEASVLAIAKHYPQVEGLHLVNCPYVVPRSGCFAALAACSSLTELNLDVGVMEGLVEREDFNAQVSERLVADLITLTSVKRLTLCECPTTFSRQLLAAAATKRAWPHLTLFRLEHCVNINNKFAIDFIQTHPHLDQLSFHSSRFTDAVLAAIGKYLPNLRGLDMTDSPSITAPGIRALTRKCPQLSFINLEYCEVKAKAFPEADLEEFLDEDQPWDDNDEPMYLNHLDKDGIDQIRRGPSTVKRRKYSKKG